MRWPQKEPNTLIFFVTFSSNLFLCSPFWSLFAPRTWLYFCVHPWHDQVTVEKVAPSGKDLIKLVGSKRQYRVLFGLFLTTALLWTFPAPWSRECPLSFGYPYFIVVWADKQPFTKPNPVTPWTCTLGERVQRGGYRDMGMFFSHWRELPVCCAWPMAIIAYFRYYNSQMSSTKMTEDWTTVIKYI